MTESGEPLDRVLSGLVELESFLRIAVGLASALTGLHKRGLIHKDIKPANILFDSATGEVRLIGLGIASRLPRDGHPNLPSLSLELFLTWHRSKRDE